MRQNNFKTKKVRELVIACTSCFAIYCLASLAKEGQPMPPWLSIFPPLVAIILAILLRQAIPALFLGVALGGLIGGIYEVGSIKGLGLGLLEVPEDYILPAVNDESHISILLFCLLIGGMINVVNESGGIMGIIGLISKRIKNVRSCQLLTWLMGLVIFFDDYANSMIVGSTMRPIADKYRISREKLSFIVDATAAPVAALAFITTWIGGEVSYIGSATSQLESFPNIGAYSIFLNSIPYSFYPILILVFVLMNIVTKRDFGPMLAKEQEARRNNSKSSDFGEEKPSEGKAINAVLPIFLMVSTVGIGLIHTGLEASQLHLDFISTLNNLPTIIGASNANLSLLWGALVGVISSIILSVFHGGNKLSESVEHLISGFQTMTSTLVILVLAWALANVTKELSTGEFLLGLIGQDPSPDIVLWLPAMAFVLSAITSFATGTSWGTMGIIYPIILSLTWDLGEASGIPDDLQLSVFYNVVASVLAGAVWGDHCSPISDTTILSSLATSCDHISHVKTQLPYSLVVGIIAIVTCYLPIILGIPLWLCLTLGIGTMTTLLFLFGKKADDGIEAL